MAGSRALLVLYGSQTGCAQEVAERIAWEGKRRFFCVRLAGDGRHVPRLIALLAPFSSSTHVPHLTVLRPRRHG